MRHPEHMLHCTLVSTSALMVTWRVRYHCVRVVSLCSCPTVLANTIVQLGRHSSGGNTRVGRTILTPNAVRPGLEQWPLESMWIDDHWRLTTCCPPPRAHGPAHSP